MKTCDEEFRDAAVDFIRRQHEADTPFFVWFNTTHMHFRTHTRDEDLGPRRPVAVALPRHDALPRRHRRPGARPARRAGHRRQHDRDVLDRQRSAHELVARRRHDAVPQREELELGGRLPRAVRRPLARPHPRRDRAERDRQPQRLVRHAAGGGGQPRHRRPAQGRRRARRAPSTRCTSTGSTSSTTSPGRPSESPAPALLLRVRRRRPDGAAVRQLEDRVPRAAGARARCAVWIDPYVELRVPEDLQPAHRPVRARRPDVEHLLRLDDQPRLPARSRPSSTWPRCCRPWRSSRPARSRPRSTSTRCSRS